MANSLDAINQTLQHEGAFVNNAADKGGATKYGITQDDMIGVNIADITVEQAVQYYQEHFWKPFMGQIASQAVANKLFDMSVLLGVSTAVRLMQRALKYPAIQQDGTWGVQTLTDINTAGDEIIPLYKNVLAAHFKWIVQTEPNQQVFLNGWINRVES